MADRVEMRERIVRVTDKVVEYSLYGLILFIPVSKAGIEIFAGLAILGFIVKKTLQVQFLFRDSPLRGQSLFGFGFVGNRAHLFLLLFFVISVLSLFNSRVYLKQSLEALIFKWLEYILIFLIVEDTLINRRRLRNALAILLLVAGVVGVDGVFQRLWGWDFLRGRQVILIKEAMLALSGPFKHYNDFAAYLVCVLSLFVAIILGTVPLKSRNAAFAGTVPHSRRGQFLFQKGIYRAGLFSGIVLLGLSLLFTFSRGGWAGFLGAGLLMLFLSRRWKVILPVVCIFALVVILAPALRERLLFSFQSGGDADRFDMWEGACAIIKENPFLGKGLGTFMDYFPQYTSGLGIRYAHNCYLQMWAEVGIFGLLSFLLFAGTILGKGMKAFLSCCVRDSPLKIQEYGLGGDSPFVLLGLVCGIFGFLVHSFFDTQLYSLQLSVLFWVMLGLTMSLGTVPLSDS